MPEVQEEDDLANGITKHTAKKISKGHLVTCGSRFLSGRNTIMWWWSWSFWSFNGQSKNAGYTSLVTASWPSPTISMSIWNKQNLDTISNQRIQRIMAKLVGYDFRLLWTPGKTQIIADALSMSPVFPAEEEQDILVCRVRAACLSNDEAVLDQAFARLITILRKTRIINPFMQP